MKRHFTSIILAAALSAFAGGLGAQYLSEIAKVPFAFHAQGRMLQPGNVTVKELDGRGAYKLTDSTGSSTFWSTGIKKNADPAKPHLTFACYGRDCVLAEVSMPGQNSASAISAASIDRELSHKIGIASMISVPLR
ncbi:MAG: hypothetical protein JOY54_20335 [Acidobacteriaceae bacterium]|nr:hypothetical protein [Acidobacteriaceae bacterium]